MGHKRSNKIVFFRAILLLRKKPQRTQRDHGERQENGNRAELRTAIEGMQSRNNELMVFGAFE
jgi:hypothetical protein